MTCAGQMVALGAHAFQFADKRLRRERHRIQAMLAQQSQAVRWVLTPLFSRISSVSFSPASICWLLKTG